MGLSAFWIAVCSTFVFAAACAPFIESLKEEAPALYASFGSPSISKYFMHKQVFMPFSSLILSREYRKTLAPYPRTRAWASWLFVIHWVQVIAFAVFLVSVFGGGA